MDYKSTAARHQGPPASENGNKMEGEFLSSHDDVYYIWFSHRVCCDYDSKPAPVEEKYREGTPFIRFGRSGSPRRPFHDRYGMDLASGGGEVACGFNGETYAPGGQGVRFDLMEQTMFYIIIILMMHGWALTH
ncbi:hypothetical protein N7451_011833 [Penicillium sp. IBT 35674x]|nr:hypothetical protein N7451_011833 [Penicillium sp. IBT 35674x]